MNPWIVSPFRSHRSALARSARTPLLVVLCALLHAWCASSRADQYSYDTMRRLTRVQYANGSTLEYVYDNSGNRLVRALSASGSASNHPPAAVSVPGIANGSTNVATSTSLSWAAASDTDAGDAVVYYVYFGTSPNPALAYSGSQTNWSPGRLQCFTTYYWYVVARDSHNAQTVGPLWSFVSGSWPPVADFSAASAGGQAPVSIPLTDQSVDVCGQIISWQWDFDDDGIVDSTNQNPVFSKAVIGDYSVKLTVQDNHGGVSSLVKTNVISVLGTNMVDLKPLTLNVESAGSYGNLVVRYTVTNLGAATTSFQWQWSDTIYISTNAFLDAAAMVVAQYAESQGLPPASVYSRTNLAPVPAVDLDLDKCYLLLKSDGNNQIAEPNENNNVLALPLHGRLPDLAPTALASSGQALSGQLIDVYYTVTNRGALDIRDLGGGAVEWYDGIYLSTNSVWDDQAAMVGTGNGGQILAAGAAYAATNTVLLPDWPPGNYYLILAANDGNWVAESNTINNALAVPVTLAAPDLAPLSVTVPNGTPSDAQVQIAYAVTNRTGAPALGIWVDALYLSTNATWDTTDYLLKQGYQLGPVPGYGTYAVTNTVRLPGWPAGAYYVILKVNDSQYLSETAQTNNTLAVPFVVQAPAGLPDLVPFSLSAPASAPVGQGILVTYAVTNCSSLTVTGVWNDIFWLSTSSVWDQTATYLGVAYGTGPLSGGGTYASTNTLNLPLLDPGDYFLFVQVNANDQVYEATTTNNFISAPIVIQSAVGLPDLTPVSLSAPASAATGQVVQVTYTVANYGSVPASGSWMDILFLSTNSVWDTTTTLLGAAMLASPVASMSNYVKTLSVKLPAVAAGAYYLILQTDFASQIAEANEDNNALARPIAVQTQAVFPDLAPVLLAAPGSAAAGQSIQITYAVTNRGAATATGQWYDQLVLSTNTAWHLSDLTLAVQARTQAVAAGSSYRVTNTVTLPVWPAGTYYLVLNADALGSLTESAETNNVLWTPLLLTAASVRPSLGGGQFLSDWRFRLAVTGALGTNYTLQASTNLAQWVRVLDLNCTGTPTYVVDVEAKNFSRRFYRVAPFTGSPPLRLDFSSPPWRGTGGLALRLDGPLGKNYRIEASTNLHDWTPISNLPNTWVPFYFSDPQSPGYQRRFYRAFAP